MKSEIAEPSTRGGSVTRAVALAFAILGPKAHSALPEVEALVSSERSLPASGNEGSAWYLALARMGKPIDEFHWDGYKPDFVARERESLRKRVERFDPKEVWRY